MIRLRKALNDIKWSERFLDKGVEEIWKIFIAIIHDIGSSIKLKR